MEVKLHSIVEQMHPSDEQRPAILACGSDVAVSAGAGAGKTRTLVARYLSLLVEDGGLPLRSVVAITFTKKAAREMRNRVREEVRHYLEKTQLSEVEHARWQTFYTGLDAARIGTIHSLCAEILRHHPAEAGIDPRFAMLDEGQMALLKVQVVQEALAWAVNDPQVVALFVLLGEDRVRALLITLLKRRLDLEQLWQQIPTEPAALLAHWETLLAAQRDKAWQAFLSDPVFVEAVEVLEQSTPLDVDDRMVQQRTWVLAALAREDVSRAEAFADFDTINLVCGSQKAWLDGRTEKEKVKTALRALRTLWRDNAEALTRRLNEADYILAEHYRALRMLSDWCLRRYAALKVELQALDFDDLESKAVALLAEHAPVRTYWQGEIRALLVDEFQDTNQRQRELLHLLDGGVGKRFIVGDGKQSIYRFRGADVTVFREVWKEIALSGRTFTLATSYRAHQALIAGLNALLKPVLGMGEDSARPYVEPFAPLAPYRVEPVTGLVSPFIELHLAVGAKSNGALERAAQAVVDRLVSLVNGDIVVHETDPESGQACERLLDYGDIAILCRASASFAAYEDALEAAGVPFLTVAGRGFYERAEVRDLLNALQAIADPTDDLALAGLLRSPVLGLSDMALYRLRQAQHTREQLSLWSLLVEGDFGFLEDEALHAAHARELIQRLHALAGRVPVADVIKTFLDATDYRAVLLRAGDARGANNLAKLLADAYTSEVVGIGAFLDYVQQLRDVGTREGEARIVARGAVQLLTIHASKGLEFPVVVIGDVARSTCHRADMVVDTELGIMLSLKGVGSPDPLEVPASVYCLALERDADRDAAESDRLLYVAATRAREMLLISGTATVRKNGDIHTSGWLARLDEALDLCDQAPLCDAEGDAVHRFMLDLNDQPVRCVIYEPMAELPFPVVAHQEGPAVSLSSNLALLAPVNVDDAAVRDIEQASPPRVWRVMPSSKHAWAPAWVVGKIVHLALEHWIFPNSAGVDFYAWAVPEVRGCGIMDDAVIGNAVRRAGRMLTRFKLTSLYQQMSAAPRCFHELPYSIITSKGVENGIIDALFEDTSGWVLVEFKTDAIKDVTALTQVLDEDYSAQVRRYQVAAEQLLGVCPRSLVCFLNYAGTVHLESL